MEKVERPGAQGRIVALAGNPNVGKSTLFNALTGLHQHTGNWPGKTVAVAQGEYVHRERRFLLIDLPGTYSLNAHSAEEEITRDFLCSGQADATVVVCDATCLERSLIFALQVMERVNHVVLCVNLLDEAHSRGLQVDLAELARQLRVPVVGTSAGRGEGLEELMDEVEYISHPGSRHGGMQQERTQEERVREAERCAAMAVTCRKEDPLAGQRKLDRLLTSKKTGIPLMLLLLGGILWLTIVASNIPSQLLSESLFAAGEVMRKALYTAGAPQWLTGMLIDGVYRVLGWVVSVMLPPMAIFFPLFTLLEDLGYLPRVAFVLDHAFHRAGACGKQSLTMCQGLGCNACGVTGCRIIDSPRERLIAIVTNSLVPCNGRFPTLIALITIFFLGSARRGPWSGVLAAAMLLGVLVLGVGMTLIVSRILSATVLRGMPSSFALELPPYRRPQVGQVVVRSILDRTVFVLGRAVAVAAPAGLVIWLCANVSVGNGTILSHITGVLDPLGRVMGLDGVILMAFVLGWPANEIVMPIILMTYLSQGTLVEVGELDAMGQLLRENGWTGLTALCTILFSLFHWPCSTTCLTVAKETGSVKWTVLAVVVPTLVGVCLCTLVAAAGRVLL